MIYVLNDEIRLPSEVLTKEINETVYFYELFHGNLDIQEKRELRSTLSKCVDQTIKEIKDTTSSIRHQVTDQLIVEGVRKNGHVQLNIKYNDKKIG